MASEFWYENYPQIAELSYPPHPTKHAVVISPEGDEIWLGPYNAQQAPSASCDQCPTPITVGEKLAYIQLFVVGVNARTGNLQMVPLREWPTPKIVHGDCTSDFCHDEISKDLCGQYGYECACGNDIDIPDQCDYCRVRFTGTDGD